ncbi:Beta/gamma crystallin [Macrophomina phaseolina MS6]|uniref:Beta/gamma crystallin n=1 Tax=Macrophomina phaseolina (strain MS6) TaxID=1126212 RepID=K2S112_MACPH|nr:Beta/gamma crystallin [Macrophomina phaseolina MS6]
MPSFQTIICAILAISAPLAAASPLPEPELEARQSLSAIRFWVNSDYSGAWADLSISSVGKCEQLPTAVKDRVSSFKLGLYNCRFYEHDNCQGANQWFDSDHTNLRIGGTWGYTGSQNDELSSAMCWLKTA